jgi:signal transduction histidine kinase
MVRDETFRATFESIGTPRPLSAAVALALHRTALEALTNVRKHAAASHVTLTLTFAADNHVRLQIQDDGRGAGALDGGFGLTSLRERAEDLGGTIAYRTEPGRGFTIDLELPA